MCVADLREALRKGRASEALRKGQLCGCASAICVAHLREAPRREALRKGRCCTRRCYCCCGPDGRPGGGGAHVRLRVLRRGHCTQCVCFCFCCCGCCGPDRRGAYGHVRASVCAGVRHALRRGRAQAAQARVYVRRVQRIRSLGCVYTGVYATGERAREHGLRDSCEEGCAGSRGWRRVCGACE